MNQMGESSLFFLRSFITPSFSPVFFVATSLVETYLRYEEEEDELELELEELE